MVAPFSIDGASSNFGAVQIIVRGGIGAIEHGCQAFGVQPRYARSCSLPNRSAHNVLFSAATSRFTDEYRNGGRNETRGARPRVCLMIGGVDGTRTRDPRRDRPVF